MNNIDAKEEYRKLVIEFNSMVAEHNATVDKIGALLGFMQIQCGVLYTAITGDPQVDNPLKPVSSLLLNSEDSKDLNYFRNGLITYIEEFQKSGDPQEAFAAYQLYLMEGK